MQEDVNILLILPHKFLYFLKVTSSMLPKESISFSQLSVSIHSFRAISNFESISARLCGYWASEMLANLNGAVFTPRFGNGGGGCGTGARFVKRANYCLEDSSLQEIDTCG